MEAGGYPREIDLASVFLSGDFDIRVQPRGRKFDMATILEDQKNLERDDTTSFLGSLFSASIVVMTKQAAKRDPGNEVAVDEQKISIVLLFAPNYERKKGKGPTIYLLRGWGRDM